MYVICPLPTWRGQIQHPTKSVFCWVGRWQVFLLSHSTVCLVLGGTYSAWRPTAIVDAPVALSALWAQYCSTRCPLLLVLVVVIPVPCYRGLSLTALLTVKDTGHLISACQCCSVGHSRAGWGAYFFSKTRFVVKASCHHGWLTTFLNSHSAYVYLSDNLDMHLIHFQVILSFLKQ